MTVYGALIYFCYLITPDEENRPLILYSGIFLIYIITPAVILSLFNGEGLGAVFNPSAWKRAINDIGSGRSCLSVLPWLFLPSIALLPWLSRLWIPSAHPATT